MTDHAGQAIPCGTIPLIPLLLTSAAPCVRVHAPIAGMLYEVSPVDPVTLVLARHFCSPLPRSRATPRLAGYLTGATLYASAAVGRRVHHARSGNSDQAVSCPVRHPSA